MNGPLRRAGAALAAMSVMTGAQAAESAQCSAKSPAARAALLELYTSEGCDSCPPADRWLTALRGRGVPNDRVIPVAWHVDYWNHLGWRDRFSQPVFSERQRATAARNRAGFVYTPQRVLNGRDFRLPALRDDFAERVAVINRLPAGAELDLKLVVRPNEFDVDLRIALTGTGTGNAKAYVVVTENELETEVRAGENRGRRLKHDFVVRTLLGPFPVGPAGLTLGRTLTAALDWNRKHSAVVAFAEDERTGETLQAVRLAICGGSG